MTIGVWGRTLHLELAVLLLGAARDGRVSLIQVRVFKAILSITVPLLRRKCPHKVFPSSMPQTACSFRYSIILRIETIIFYQFLTHIYIFKMANNSWTVVRYIALLLLNYRLRHF